MAAKAILDVEINSKEFDDFAAAFGGFQSDLKEAPKDWSVFGDAMAGAVADGIGLSGISEIIQDLGKQMGSYAQSVELAIAGQGRLKNETEKTQGVTHKLAEAAKSVAGSFVSAAKWLTIGGGLAGLATGAGLFGLDHLAGSFVSARRAATGLGVDLADQRAFRVNYSSFVDPDSLLSNVANARNDVNQQWIFRSLGIGGDEEGRLNNTDLSARVIDQVRGLIRNVPEQMLSAFAQARGIDQLLSIEDLRRLRREPDAEFGRARDGYTADRRDFRIPEAEQLALRDFYRALQRAGVTIETALARPLAHLAGPLAHLSESVAKLIKAFLGSDVVSYAIDQLATALDSKDVRDAMANFAKYLGDPKGFSADIQGLFKDLKHFFGDLSDTLSDAKFVFHTLAELLGQKLDPEINLFGLKLHPFALDKPESTAPGVADSPAAHLWNSLKGILGISSADATPSAGGAADASFPTAGDARIAGIRDRLAKDLGIDPAVAGGFLSPLYAESGLRGILQHDAQGNEMPNGDAGWEQTHGPRRAAFMQWAKDHGWDWRSDQANYSFLLHELQGRPDMLARLRGVHDAHAGANVGDEFERGHPGAPGDYYYREHLQNADRFARLPSPRAAAPAVPPAPLAPPPAPVPAVPRPTADARPGGGDLAITLEGIRRALTLAGQTAGRVQVAISNDTAARVAVSARGVAV